MSKELNIRSKEENKKMNIHRKGKGGWRGGGRPKSHERILRESKAIRVEKAREYVVKKVVRDMHDILTAQIEAAKGLYVMETNEKGKVLRRYRKEPDFKVGEYLLNQSIGKPKEVVEQQGEIKLKIDF